MKKLCVHVGGILVLNAFICMMCGCSDQEWKTAAEKVCAQQDQLIPMLKRIKSSADVEELTPKVEDWRDEYIVLMNQFSDIASKTNIAQGNLEEYETRFDNVYDTAKIEAERITGIIEHGNEKLNEAISVIFYAATSRSNPFSFAKSQSQRNGSINAE